MLEIEGDLWDFHREGAWIGITTNGDVTRDGKAVMGRGTALQTTQLYPEFPKLFGTMLRDYGNRVFYFDAYRIITLPVKHHWHEKADLELIRQSVFELRNLSNSKDWRPVFLPRPGCGNGKLRWEDVKPICEAWLDDGFTVVERA